MRRLFLFRHAKAEPHGARPDHERRLAERGRHDAAEMGQRLAGLGWRPDLVLCSTSKRTEETWDLAAPAFDPPPPVRKDRRIYEASSEQLLDVLRSASPAAASVVLVGHNPGFEELVALLRESTDSEQPSASSPTMPTAAIAVFEADLPVWTDVGPAGMRLVQFLTPGSEDA